MIQISRLSNGLRVVTDTMKEVETVSLGVWCGVGSRFETPEISGISHLLEHMAFKGTTRRTPLQIAEEVENVGGYMNAYTSEEKTAYYVKMLKQDALLGMDIVADILQNSTMNAQELEKEKAVVLQEIGRAYDSPDDIIFDYFGTVAYPEQAVGRPVLGSKETVSAISSEQLKNYMHQEYTAPRLVLSAAGNISHEFVVDMAEKLFANLRTDGGHDAQKAEYVGGEFFQARPIEQVNLLFGLNGVGIHHPLHMSQKILATILGGGMSSRLFQEIREKRGMVYSIFAYARAFQDTGDFMIYAGTGKNEAHDLLSVLSDEMIKAQKGFDKEEIERAKNQLKAQLLMKLESTSARCERNAKQVLDKNKVSSVEESVAQINAVSNESLQEILALLFRSKPTLIGVGPVEKMSGTKQIEEKLSGAVSAR